MSCASMILFSFNFFSIGNSTEKSHTLLPKKIILSCQPCAWISQWFQSSTLVVDIVTTRLNRPRGRFSAKHLKCIIRWEGRNGVTIKSFSIMQGMKTRQALYKTTTPKKFILTKLCLGQI